MTTVQLYTDNAMRQAAHMRWKMELANTTVPKICTTTLRLDTDNALRQAAHMRRTMGHTKRIVQQICTTTLQPGKGMHCVAQTKRTVQQTRRATRCTIRRSTHNLKLFYNEMMRRVTHGAMRQAAHVHFLHKAMNAASRTRTFSTQGNEFGEPHTVQCGKPHTCIF